MPEVHHMKKQILLDKTVSVTWERHTGFQVVGGRIKVFINLPCFFKSKGLSGIKVRESTPLGGHLPLLKYTVWVEKHTAAFSCDNCEEKPLFTGSSRRKCMFNFWLSIRSNIMIFIVFSFFCSANDLLFGLLLWNSSYLPLCMKCWMFNLSSHKCPVYTHTQQTSALSACSYNQGCELTSREFRVFFFLVESNKYSSSWASFGS